MAVIGKIREKSTLLLVVIGIAMLAFILGDMLSSGASFGNQPQHLGEIGGEIISGNEFEAKVQEFKTNYQERQNVAEVPQAVESQIREEVWNMMLRDRIMTSQYAELGVVVGTKELGDMMYGSNPHPQIVQSFTDPNTGQFDPQNVIRFIKNLDQDKTGKSKKQWLAFEADIKKRRLADKYNQLIAKGLYVTSSEAKTTYVESNKKMNFQYIVKNYNAVADSTVTVTDSDIKAYYDDHQNEFEQDRQRNIQYVSISVIPSEEDSAEARDWSQETYKKFLATENDSLFVSVNSDNEFDRNLYSKALLPASIDTSIMDQDSVGYAVAPELMADGTYRMMKISKIKYAPDSVKARHILITNQQISMDSALVRIDSIKTALENGADFAELARTLSQDPTNKEDSGLLGWFREGMMLKAINDTCFSAKVGEFKIVESRIGAHVFQVLDKSPVVKKIQLAVVDRKIEASSETINRYFSTANDIIIGLEQGKEFDNLAAESNLGTQVAQLKENDNTVNEIPASRTIVRWAFNANEGDVSDAYSIADKFVIAQLKEAKEDGVAPFDKVKEIARLGAIKEKKAELFMQQMTGEDINSIAGETGVDVRDVSDVSFSAFSIPQIGFEPNLLGKVFSLKQNDLSRPIKGNNGVYVVYVQSVTEASDVEDYSPYKTQLVQGRQSRVGFEVFEALKEKADIQDNRYLFY